jgi:hypothetical protein
VGTAATAAATAATATTAGLREILGRRYPTEFKGHADILADLFLKRLEFLLCGKEIAGHFVVKKSLASGFKLADFRRAQLDAGMLFLVQFLTALVDALILKAGTVIVEEALHALLKLEK